MKLIVPPLTFEPNTTHPILGTGPGPYAHVILGDLGGLTQFGVHIEVLPPHSRSSFRHWHETEDEMIQVLSGEVVLIEDSETTLQQGDVACWPAGSPIGHCLMNRSDADATYLTVGTRKPNDVVHYPDHDLVVHKVGALRRYFHADGRERLQA